MRSAVCSEVPEGASTFPSWWSSTISTESKWGAASSQKRMSNTAPMAKLAATTQLGAPAAGPANCRRQSSRSRWVTPVVPTTAWMPAAAHTGRVARTASMRVKSTATSTPASAMAVASAATATDPASAPTSAGEIGADEARVDGADEFETRATEHGPAHLSAHAAASADDTDTHHL